MLKIFLKIPKKNVLSLSQKIVSYLLGLLDLTSIKDNFIAKFYQNQNNNNLFYLNLKIIKNLAIKFINEGSFFY